MMFSRLWLVILLFFSGFLLAESLHTDPIKIPSELTNKLKLEGSYEAANHAENIERITRLSQQETLEIINNEKIDVSSINQLRKKLKQLKTLKKQLINGVDFRSDIDGSVKNSVSEKSINEELDNKINALTNFIYAVEVGNQSHQITKDNIKNSIDSSHNSSEVYYDVRKKPIDMNPNVIGGNNFVESNEVDFDQYLIDRKNKSYFFLDDRDSYLKKTDQYKDYIKEVFDGFKNFIFSKAESGSDEEIKGCYSERSNAAQARINDLNINVYMLGADPKVTKLAQSLNYSPLKIFEFMSNEIDYLPYRGAIQSALSVLESKQANDIDQATLLIALLRASNIPARYVSGDIYLEDKPMHYYWHRTLSYNGMNSVNVKNKKIVDSKDVVINGRKNKKTNHVWVEACIPYANYRGTNVAEGGYRWIPFSPSFKLYKPKQGLSVATSFDYASYLSTRKKQLPLEIYFDKLLEDARKIKFDASLVDIGTTWEKETVNYDFIPHSLPFVISAYRDWSNRNSNVSRWSAIPQNWIKYATIGFDSKQFALTYSTFANHRVTFSFRDAHLNNDHASKTAYFNKLAATASWWKWPPEAARAEMYASPVTNNFLQKYRSGGQTSCTGPAMTQPELKVDGKVLATFDAQPACVPYSTVCNTKTFCKTQVPIYKKQVCARDCEPRFGLRTIGYWPSRCFGSGLNRYCLPREPIQHYVIVGHHCYNIYCDYIAGYRCTEIGKSTTCDLKWSPAFNSYSLNVVPTLNGQQEGSVTRYTNKISPLEYYALQLYTPNQSEEFLAKRFARLSKRITEVSNPWQDPDETIGEFLHISGRKYLRYLEEGNNLIGQVYNETAQTKDAVIMTSLRGDVKFVYDTPYAVFSDGYLIDAYAYWSSSKLLGGSGADSALSLSGINASAYETYIWQENAHVDAISTVSGLQIAKDQNIPVATLNSAAQVQSFLNICATKPAAGQIPDCYTQEMANAIKSWFKGTPNEKFTIPKKPISVPGFTGYVYLGDKPGKKTYAIGPYKGGYSMPANNTAFYSSGWNYLNNSSGFNWTDNRLTSDPNFFSNGWNWDFSSTTNSWTSNTNYSSINTFNFQDYGVEYFTPNSTPSILSSTISTGYSNLMTWAGDPVNMVTGNMYHEETDFEIPTKGLPIVFKRSYNSRNIIDDGPLGKGWTHSFNQSLKFVTSKGASKPTEIVWTVSDGGKKFIKLSPHTIYTNNVLSITADKVTIPKGHYFTISRPYSSGAIPEIIIREKSGISYHFANVQGQTNNVAKLTAITDANGQKITLQYANGQLNKIIDMDNRSISFSYQNKRIHKITLDWTGDNYLYDYSSFGLLATVKNPLDQQRKTNTASYTYYQGGQTPNSTNRLKTFTYANGYNMTFDYYVNGRVHQHHDGNGHSQTFTYNDFRRESVVTDELGNKTRYMFNPHGQPLEIKEADGAITRYRYDNANDPQLRTKTTDAVGLATAYNYDAQGNIIQELQASGASIDYRFHNRFGKPQLIKDANNNYHLKLYDAKGNLVDDIVFKAGFGANINPNTLAAGTFNAGSWASQILSWTYKQYDAQGRVTQTRRVKDFSNRNIGPYTTYSYTGSINSGQQPTQVSYYGDLNGDNTIAANEGLGTYKSSYDKRGRLETGFNQRLYPISYHYDAAGNITKATDNNGELRDYTYDASGLLLTETFAKVSPGGIYTVYDMASKQYDAMNRLIGETDATGAVTQYQYDAKGNLIKSTSPDGYVLTYAYDKKGRLVKAFNEEGHTVKRQLDALGRIKVLTDPNGNATQYTYYGKAQNGRLKRITSPENRWTEFHYDAGGRVVKTLQGRNDSTIYENLSRYDALGRVVRTVQSSYNDTVLGKVRPVTTYTYNSLGHKTQIKAGYTTKLDGSLGADVLKTQATYTYDDFGRLLTTTNALGKVARVEQYDVHGNPLRVKDFNGHVTTYTYGYNGTLLTQNSAGSATHPAVNITYTRNGLGLPTQISSNHSTYTYGYDRAYRLRYVTDGRNNKTIAYDYSIGGLLNKICVSSNNTYCDAADQTTAYLYDPVGRLTTVRSPDNRAVLFSYDAGGRLRQKAFPNMVEEVYNYHKDNRIKNIAIRDRARHQNAAVMNYLYDDAGRTQKTLHNFWGVQSVTDYSYDGLGRLTQANANWYQESVAYDPYGNRRYRNFKAGSNPAINMVYEHNDLHQITKVHKDAIGSGLLFQFSYDNNGNTIRELSGQGITNFSYDAINRLTKVVHPKQGTGIFKHDHGHRRISQTLGGKTTHSLHSGSDIIAQYSQDWSQQQRYFTHGPRIDEPLVRLENNSAHYFHGDAQGSIIAITAPVADNRIPVSNIVTYTAWGLANISLQSTAQPYAFAGREPSMGGQIHMRHRYYNPLFGRFTQQDPLGFVDGVNQYAYALNSPANYIDPWGTTATRFTNTLSDVGAYARGAVGNGVGYLQNSYNNYLTGVHNDLNARYCAPNCTPTITREDATMFSQLTGATIGSLPVGRLVGSGSSRAVSSFQHYDKSFVKRVSNPVPSTVARIVPDTQITRASGTLGRPGVDDVFVTAADDIRGLNATQIAKRLTIPESPTGFRVIEFPAPRSGIASPVNRVDPGFIGGGRTAGGAREFVIPNGSIPVGANTRVVP